MKNLISNLIVAAAALDAAVTEFIGATNVAFMAIQPRPQAHAWNAIPGEPGWQISTEAAQRIAAAGKALSEARQRVASAIAAMAQTEGQSP